LVEELFCGSFCGDGGEQEGI